MACVGRSFVFLSGLETEREGDDADGENEGDEGWPEVVQSGVWGDVVGEAAWVVCLEGPDGSQAAQQDADDGGVGDISKA